MIVQPIVTKKHESANNYVLKESTGLKPKVEMSKSIFKSVIPQPNVMLK